MINVNEKSEGNMVDLLTDIEKVLESAVICLTEGASDEKRMVSLHSLESMQIFLWFHLTKSFKEMQD